MKIQELVVVKRLSLPIKFFVLKNDGYVSIRNTQDTHFSGNRVASGRDSGLTLPELRKNAAVYDIPYRRLDSSKDIYSTIVEILYHKGPIICEVMLPPTHITEPKASVYKKSDGSFMARPMEDLAPFLSREELKENMYVELLDDE